MDVLGIFRRYGFAAVVTVGLGLMVLVVAGKTIFAGADPSAATAAPSRGGQAKGGGPGGGAPLVTAVAVGPHTFTDGLQAIGTAQARESIVLTPKVADTIRALRFDSGDRVRRGQVLVEMSSVEQAADLAEARAANDAAQEELRRYQELYERGFASQARLDTVRAAADAAQARYNAGGSRAPSARRSPALSVCVPQARASSCAQATRSARWTMFRKSSSTSMSRKRRSRDWCRASRSSRAQPRIQSARSKA